ncbi:FkbM family methyltransferase [Metallosphaera tengchongensis]|uniref:FkbM family methyltransferase n=1 Tax=Metallosphaera tengchongensis TaxID=1532350 RepID=A0A6N0NZ78_9CREN|nr:FkbM family methyltransferase [Metallosphaera tengchongensis]QKR01133.1 FkbM family methyltransferase [Metallosphaera tengchongensis]
MNIPPPKRFLELIRQYRITYRNWYDVMFSIFINRAQISCVLNNGQRITLDPKEAVLLAGLNVISLDIDTLIFNYKGRRMIIKGWKYGYPGDSFSDYVRLNVNDKRVLDVGASIGDSPIYFSLAGAKEIVAVEVDKKRVELMRENLRINGINNVMVIDKGVGTSDTENQVSYFTLVKDYGPFDVAKIDCDGCERALIKYVKEIPELLIEWDYTYNDLVYQLRRNGYKVMNEYALYNTLGFLHAWRE